MIVAFIGADGVGKTTLAKAVTLKLKAIYPNVRFEKAFEDYFLINNLLNILKSKRKELSQNIFFKKKYKPPFLIRLIWPLIIFFDQLALYVYIKLALPNTLVICDRYLYSYLVTWEYYGMSNRFIRWLYLNFPRPDICIILDASSSIAMARKIKERSHRGKEYNLGFFKFHKTKYLELAALLHIKPIDTTKLPIDAVAGMVVEKIRERCSNE